MDPEAYGASRWRAERHIIRAAGQTESAPRAGLLAELQRIVDATLAHLAIDELLEELLNRIVEIVAADTAAFLLLEPAGKILRARAAKGIEEEVEQGVRLPVGPGF